jgi:predicted alpha/beta hydrolase family esterase
MPRTFLILHGWRNYRPPGHWEFELAKDLTALGEDLRYPQLPTADAPIRREWLAELSKVWQTIPQENEKIVIAHSLGTILWLHAAAELELVADRVLLVAPPGPSAIEDEPHMRDFSPFPDGLDASRWRVVTSDADPYCVEGAAEFFGARYGIAADVVVGAAHFALDGGYGRWPAVLAWALNPETRLTAR